MKPYYEHAGIPWSRWWMLQISEQAKEHYGKTKPEPQQTEKPSEEIQGSMFPEHYRTVDEPDDNDWYSEAPNVRQSRGESIRRQETQSAERRPQYGH